MPWICCNCMFGIDNGGAGAACEVCSRLVVVYMYVYMCMCECMYVCIYECVYVCICIYVYVCVYIWMSVCVYVYICMCVFVCISIYIIYMYRYQLCVFIVGFGRGWHLVLVLLILLWAIKYLLGISDVNGKISFTQRYFWLIYLFCCNFL